MPGFCLMLTGIFSQCMDIILEFYRYGIMIGAHFFFALRSDSFYSL
jgi:hypothetical protein